MTTMVHERGGDERLRVCVARPCDPSRTPTGEYPPLLKRVTVRVDALLCAAAEQRWPARELEALLECLRAEVLRQATDGDGLLCHAHGSPPGLARLHRDHARLRAGTEVLERAAAGEGTRSPTQLAVTARDLLVQLERHLVAEEALLAVCAPGSRRI